eukprot:GEMP01002357.1.p1 GENE.GEMP01002357.1~~GEMP01002357.1.p1  ORF type:complete len:1041 (+),score=192.51 GEMP01002357.1:582-3704(+)
MRFLEQGHHCRVRLKQKKEVISFRDPSSRQRCASVAWNPEISTQLVAAYDDDLNPAIQMWDLRNPQYPFKELSAHSKGVMCVSYNPLDHNLLISSGKDGRTVVWCQESGTPEVFCEIPTNQYNFDVKWSPTCPALFTASSINNAVGVHSMQQNQNPSVLYVPKWYEKPCGASFGFAGKFCKFGKTKNTVSLYVTPNEPEIVPGADRFEEWIQANNFAGYCEEKVNHFRNTVNDPQEALIWELMSLYITTGIRNEQFSPQVIVEKLGFCSMEILINAEKFLGAKPGAQLADTSPISKKSTFHHQSVNYVSDVMPDFFEKLAEKAEANEIKKKQEEEDALSLQLTLATRSNAEGVTNWDAGPELLVKQALLIGNLPCAVEVCLKSSRYADALLLASGGGNDLWKRTRDEYMRIKDDPFLNQIGCIMSSEFDVLVMDSDLQSWKETLSIIATYASLERYRELCCLLAERLEKEKFDVRSALLCYICAKNFPKTVHIWANMASGHASQKLALQDLVQKMTVWQEATRFNEPDAVFSAKLSLYANVLANSGRLVPAMRQLARLPEDLHSGILKDRIYQSSPEIMASSFGRPPRFPYEIVDVRPTIQAPVAQPGYAGQTGHYPGQHGQGGPRPPMGPGGQPGPRGNPGPRPPMGVAGGFPNQPAGNTYAGRPPMPPAMGPGAQHQYTPNRPTGPPGPPGPGAYHPNTPPNRGPAPPSFGGPSSRDSATGYGPPVPGRVSAASTFGRGPHGPAPPAVPRPPVPASAAHNQPPRPGFVGGAPPSAPGGYGAPGAPGGYGNQPAPQPQPGYGQPQPGYGQPQPGYGQPAGYPGGYGNQPPAQPQPGFGQPPGVPGGFGNQPRPQQQSYGAPYQPPAGGYGGPPVSAPQAPAPGPQKPSTAPTASAAPIIDGLPVAWPVPTATQNLDAVNQATLAGNVSAQGGSAQVVNPWNPQDVQFVQNILSNLLSTSTANDPNRRRYDDVLKRLNELYEKMQAGTLSQPVAAKVLELCQAVERQDFPSALKAQVELCSSGWEQNKNWLQGLKRIISR